MEGVVLCVDPVVGRLQLVLLPLQLGLAALGIHDAGAEIVHTGSGLCLELVETPLRILDLEIDVLELLVQNGMLVVGLLRSGLGLGQPRL